MSRPDIDIVLTSTRARGVLASAATLHACRESALPCVRPVPARMPPGRDELLRLISVSDAIRVNAAALPQSLREFILPERPA